MAMPTQPPVVKLTNLASAPETSGLGGVLKSWLPLSGGPKVVKVPPRSNDEPGYLRKALNLVTCGQCAGHQKILSARATKAETAVTTYVKNTAHCERMLAQVKSILDADHTIVARLVDPKGDYRPLLEALKVPASDLNTLQQNNGDLSKLTKKPAQGAVVKAVIALVLEQNVLSDKQLSRRVYEAVFAAAKAKNQQQEALSSADEIAAMESTIADEEMIENFLGELLGNRNYRTDLANAAADVIARGAVKLASVNNVDHQMQINALLNQYLKGLSDHTTSKLREDHKAKLMAQGKSEAEAASEAATAIAELPGEPVFDELLTHGLDAPSILLTLAVLVSSHDSYQPDYVYDPENPEHEPKPNKMLRELTTAIPLLGDLICGEMPLEIDGVTNRVDFAPSRAFHQSAMHAYNRNLAKMGGITGERGDIIRARVALYFCAKRLNRNLLVLRIIQQATQSKASSASSMLDKLVAQGLIKKDGDGYGLALDLTNPAQDETNAVIRGLASSIESSGSIQILFRSLVLEGDKPLEEETPLDPDNIDPAVKAKNDEIAQRNQLICNMAEAADILEHLLSPEEYRQCMAYRMERGIKQLQSENLRQNAKPDGSENTNNQPMDVDRENTHNIQPMDVNSENGDDPFEDAKSSVDGVDLTSSTEENDGSNSSNTSLIDTDRPNRGQDFQPVTLQEVNAAYAELMKTPVGNRSAAEKKLLAQYRAQIRALKKSQPAAPRVTPAVAKKAALAARKAAADRKKLQEIRKDQVKLRRELTDKATALKTMESQLEAERSSTSSVQERLQKAQRELTRLKKQVEKAKKVDKKSPQPTTPVKGKKKGTPRNADPIPDNAEPRRSPRSTPSGSPDVPQVKIRAMKSGRQNRVNRELRALIDEGASSPVTRGKRILRIRHQ